MREKIKFIVLGMLLSVSLLLITLSLSNMFLCIKDDKLSKSNLYDDLYNKIQLKIGSIDKVKLNDKEKNILNLINEYLLASKEFANIKSKKELASRISKNEKSFLTFYTNIKDYIDDDSTKSKLATMVVSITAQNEEILQDVLYDYSIDFNINYIFRVTIPETTNMLNQTARLTELYIIEEVIDELYEVAYE